MTPQTHKKKHLQTENCQVEKHLPKRFYTAQRFRGRSVNLTHGLTQANGILKGGNTGLAFPTPLEFLRERFKDSFTNSIWEQQSEPSRA